MRYRNEPCVKSELSNTETSMDKLRPRATSNQTFDGVPDNGAVLHAPAGYASGRMESFYDKRRSLSGFSACVVDSISRACSTVRLDWHLHSRNRILFNTELAQGDDFRFLGRLVDLVSLDLWRGDEMDSRNVPVGMASASSPFGT